LRYEQLNGGSVSLKIPEQLSCAVAENGFCGPVRLLDQHACELFLRHESENQPVPLDWWKGRAATDLFYAVVACDQRIIRLLRALLGNNIILWGIDIIHRAPGEIHPWHCDIESCAPEGGFVSVWIGLRNTSRESALKMVTKSHKFGRTIQEQAYRQGLRRGEATDQIIMEWAKQLNPTAELVIPEMEDGNAMFFDGRLWHGTWNTRQTGTRAAILLQYASADRPVRMIDLNHLEWPFRFREDLRPPVLVVSGQADLSANRVVPFPRGS